MDDGDRLVEKYAAERPVSRSLYERAGDVLADRLGHDLRQPVFDDEPATSGQA